MVGLATPTSLYNATPSSSPRRAVDIVPSPVSPAKPSTRTVLADGARIGLVMGSQSDWETMRAAADVLAEFAIPFDARVVSAHRMPDRLFEYAEDARDNGLVAIIAGAGGAAHLPGMLASKTTVPVLGVPVASKHLNGLDSLYSIVQMPKGIPVATFAIGSAGAANAALFAVAMMAMHDTALATRLAAWREDQTRAASQTRLDL